MAESSYWDSRYRAGGTSGPGSIGSLREWKWSVLEKQGGPLQNVIDVGCGDLSFWDGRDCDHYTGIDISPTIQRRNKIARPYWKFATRSADQLIPGLEADTVLCLDMLFHIMDDSTYRKILENLCHYSTNQIFIYTWINNPFTTLRAKLRAVRLNHTLKPLIDSTTDGKYQKYRDFLTYLPVFQNNGFLLIANEQTEINPYGAMFIFQKAP